MPTIEFHFSLRRLTPRQSSYTIRAPRSSPSLRPATAEVHRCLGTREEDRKSIYFPNRIALCRAERAGGCQGCRARATLERNPGLVDLFLGFWGRADAWPQSPSWTDGICTHDGPDRESRTRRAPPSIEEEEAA